MDPQLPESCTPAQFGALAPVLRAARGAVRCYGVGGSTAILVGSMVASSVILSSAMHTMIGLPVNGHSIAVAALIPLALAWPIGGLNLRLVWLLDLSERNHSDLARHDVLTRLLSRNEFLQRGFELLEQRNGEAVEIRSGADVWAMMIDIDHFKSVNDEHGHHAGDEALIHVAELVHGLLRPGDEAGRYGGDEMVVLLSRLESPEAIALAEQLRSRVEQTPFALADGCLRHLTISAGLARIDDGEASVEPALARADEVLLQAKRAGRNQVRVAASVNAGNEGLPSNSQHQRALSLRGDRPRHVEPTQVVSTFDRAPAIVRLARRYVADRGATRFTLLLTAFITAVSVVATFVAGLIVPPVQPYMLLVATIVPIVTAGPAIWFAASLVWQLDASERLQVHLASHDGLTGLLGRRAFFERGQRSIEQSRREGRACWVMMADLDRFKQINDEYGHAAGDQALRQIAQRCREAAHPGDLLGRYGGDELVMLLVDTDPDGARATAERLRTQVAAHPIDLGNGKRLAATTSVGLALVDPNDVDLDAALRRADGALRDAKAQGRDRVQIA